MRFLIGNYLFLLIVCALALPSLGSEDISRQASEVGLRTCKLHFSSDIYQIGPFRQICFMLTKEGVENFEHLRISLEHFLQDKSEAIPNGWGVDRRENYINLIYALEGDHGTQVDLLVNAKIAIDRLQKIRQRIGREKLGEYSIESFIKELEQAIEVGTSMIIKSYELFDNFPEIDQMKKSKRMIRSIPMKYKRKDVSSLISKEIIEEEVKRKLSVVINLENIIDNFLPKNYNDLLKFEKQYRSVKDLVFGIFPSHSKYTDPSKYRGKPAMGFLVRGQEKEKLKFATASHVAFNPAQNNDRLDAYPVSMETELRPYFRMFGTDLLERVPPFFANIFGQLEPSSYMDPQNPYDSKKDFGSDFVSTEVDIDRSKEAFEILEIDRADLGKYYTAGYPYLRGSFRPEAGKIEYFNQALKITELDLKDKTLDAYEFEQNRFSYRLRKGHSRRNYEGNSGAPVFRGKKMIGFLTTQTRDSRIKGGSYLGMEPLFLWPKNESGEFEVKTRPYLAEGEVRKYPCFTYELKGKKELSEVRKECSYKVKNGKPIFEVN